jgi:hypothetical protein
MGVWEEVEYKKEGSKRGTFEVKLLLLPNPSYITFLDPALKRDAVNTRETARKQSTVPLCHTYCNLSDDDLNSASVILYTRSCI